MFLTVTTLVQILDNAFAMSVLSLIGQPMRFQPFFNKILDCGGAETITVIGTLKLSHPSMV